jgi:hypothetical protein
MEILDLNARNKNAEFCIHMKKAFRIVIKDDEAFEVVRADDPELTKTQDAQHKGDFYRNPKELILFSTERLTICSKVPISDIDYSKVITIEDLKQDHKIAEKIREFQALLSPVNQEPQTPAKSQANGQKRDAKGKFTSSGKVQK